MHDALQAPWQRTLRSFAGRGIQWPSETMRVSDAEALALLPALADRAWSAPLWSGDGGYAVRHAAGTCDAALFHAGGIVGFYAESSLWIARAHRGRGLSTQLILAAAGRRGGRSIPPGVVFQGYTAAGVAAHRSAHRHAVRSALARGLPVPAEVLAEAA